KMIFMGMGQHQPHQVLALFLDELDIRQNEIDARQMLLIAERHAKIDRQKAPLLPVAKTIQREVHANLADTAKRNESKFVRPRHHRAPVEAASPKKTSPAATGIRWPSDVAIIMQPVLSMVSKMPSTVVRPRRTE